MRESRARAEREQNGKVKEKKAQRKESEKCSQSTAPHHTHISYSQIINTVSACHFARLRPCLLFCSPFICPSACPFCAAHSVGHLIRLETHSVQYLFLSLPLSLSLSLSLFLNEVPHYYIFQPLPRFLFLFFFFSSLSPFDIHSTRLRKNGLPLPHSTTHSTCTPRT